MTPVATSLDAAVATRNRAESLGRCLDALASGTTLPAELLVMLGPPSGLACGIGADRDPPSHSPR